MMTRLKSPFAGLLVWTCFSCFALDTKAEDTSGEHYSAQLRDVEKRLGAYLTKRVLVFRKSQIGRHHIKFDSRGCPANESGPELKARSNAMLFTALTLNPEHLVILGEAARIPPGMQQPVLSRHAQEFKLVICTIMLDVPPDEMTFAHAIGLLCRVFLTREEFQGAMFGDVDSK